MTPMTAGSEGLQFAEIPAVVFVRYAGTLPDPNMTTELPEQCRKPLAEHRR